eukprot:1860059-Alexandrium_andersonii.AAC.1
MPCGSSGVPGRPQLEFARIPLEFIVVHPEPLVRSKAHVLVAGPGTGGGIKLPRHAPHDPRAHLCGAADVAQQMWRM